MNHQRYHKYIVFLGVVGLSSSSILAKLSTAPSIIIALYRTCFSVLLLPIAIRNRAELAALSVKQVLS